MGHDETIRFTADAVLLSEISGDLNVLLIQRKWEPFTGKWALPGGHVDIGEEVDVAAHRELAEETGISGVNLEPVNVYSKVGRDPRGRYVTVAHVALLDHTPEPVAADDADAAEWFPIDDLLAHPEWLAFDHAQIIADAVAHVRCQRNDAYNVTTVVGSDAHVDEVVGLKLSFG